MHRAPAAAAGRRGRRRFPARLIRHPRVQRPFPDAPRVANARSREYPALHGKLIYLLNTSLDGFVETPDHSLDWANVDESSTLFNEQERTTDASLYGRGMWETMSPYWPTAESDPAASETMKEYGRFWAATPKIVFSSTLDAVEGNARLVRGDIADELAKVRREFDGDLAGSGATWHRPPFGPAWWMSTASWSTRS